MNTKKRSRERGKDIHWSPPMYVYTPATAFRTEIKIILINETRAIMDCEGRLRKSCTFDGPLYTKNYRNFQSTIQQNVKYEIFIQTIACRG